MLVETKERMLELLLVRMPKKLSAVSWQIPL